MQKTKIEWTDYTWNPIKGICPVGCFYCYARKMYGRFKWGDFLRLEYKTLDAPMPKKPSKIFVCSTMEIFHTEIKASWRDCIFDQIKRHPQHTFQILTKFPQNIDRPMPDNVWLGCTADKTIYMQLRAKELVQKKSRIKFISFEPLFEYPHFDQMTTEELLKIDWIIIGRLTGYGKKYDPPKWWVTKIVEMAKFHEIKIFLKDNLKDIWGEDLIQEMPE